MRLSHRLLRPRLRGNAFMIPRKHPRKLRAKTHYELLGVRPDDDAKTLQSAFRDAAKAYHPDLNPGDPDAPERFTQVVTAYRILRDVVQRDAYDQLLAFKRARRRANLRRIIASDAAAIVALVVIMVGGYTLFAQRSKMSVEAAKAVEVAARKLVEIAAVELTIGAETTNRDQPFERPLESPEIVAVPSALLSKTNTGSPPAIAVRKPAEIHVVEPTALPDTSAHGEPSGKFTGAAPADAPIMLSALAPEAERREPSITANGRPAPDSTRSNSVMTTAINAVDAPVDRDDTRNGADDHRKNGESNSLDQNGVRSLESRFSSSEKGKSPSSHLAIFDQKMRTNTKLRGHAKQPATDRTFVRQAAVDSRDFSRVALESRNTLPCASSCSARPPPLFGVGF
jgi:DnaJ-domain-containing protein 1